MKRKFKQNLDLTMKEAIVCGPATLSKRDSSAGVKNSCEYCEIFKNTIFIEDL